MATRFRVRSAVLCTLMSCIPCLAFAHELPLADGGAPAEPEFVVPALLEQVQPEYPEEARKAGIGGAVTMEVTVGADGTATDVKVVRAAGFGFDEAAVAAVKQFKFRPAVQNGEAVPATVLFEQKFAIQSSISATATAPAAPVAQETPAPPSYQTTVVARGPSSAASSTTIRNLDFDLRPKTSPNDVLRVVPGLLAVQHQGGGKADQLFLRGFDADHGTDVGVFVDGIPINMPSHAHGQGYADLHWLIPEALERIDVVKGPYDAQYGDFSTAGAVNLVTKDRFDESSAQYTIGSLPTISGRAVSAGRFVGIASLESERAPRLHPWVAFEAAYDDGPFEASEDLKRYNLFAKLTYDVSPQLKVGTFLQAYGSGWIGSGQIPAREVAAGRLDEFGSEDPSEGGQSERQMLTTFLKYESGAQELEATAYVTRYRLALFNDFTFLLQDPVNGDEIEQDDARTVTGARVDYHCNAEWKGISLRTTVGGQARNDAIHVDRWNATSLNGAFRQRLGRRIDTSVDGFSGNDDDIDQQNVAAYLNEDVVFGPHLRLVAGLRDDFFGFNVNDLNQSYAPGAPNTSGTRQFTVLSPKASAVVTPVPGMLDLYLNYGTGFHTNMAQIALINGTTQVNPDGTAFTVRAIPRLFGGEVGARAHLFERVDVAAALWMSYLQNETVFDADNAVFVPSAPTRRVGVDVEARVKLLPWLYADVDLAQATSTAVANGGNGGAVALAPKLYMTGGLTAKHASGIRGGLRFRYLGPRPAFDESSPEYQYFTSRLLPNGQPNPDYDPSRVNAQGYFLLDAYASYRWRSVEVSLSIQNLLNSVWREAQFGNRSCTRDETYNPSNSNYAGSGNQLSDGSYADRCGIAYAGNPAAGVPNTRSGVVDVHYTPGVPFNPQLTVKGYF